MKLVIDKERPIQFLFAGKAHPRDDEGKRYIQHIIHLSKFTELKGHLVFIENYDMHVARQMISGCDVWLNNPRRPLRHPAPAGKKPAATAALNLSILDGWWREGYDGTNGFAIGDDSHPDSVELQDQRDSENLYRVLTEEVIPSFYSARCERAAASMDSEDPPGHGHAGATIQYLAYGSGIHPKILCQIVARLHAVRAGITEAKEINY